MAVQRGGQIREKVARVRGWIAEYKTVLVAFSGGVDSTLLLKLCRDVLGPAVSAVTVISPLHAPAEGARARHIAAELGVRHRELPVDLLAEERVARNDASRCYWCKKILFSGMRDMAAQAVVLDGSNASDRADFRPGVQAARELGVRSPLQEAGLEKEEIRSLSRDFALPTWNVPAQACLATRFAYGTPLSYAKVAAVAAAEASVQKILAVPELRLRHHGETARLEIPPDAFPRLFDPRIRQEVIAAVRKSGYVYVSCDLAGYRSGSMNEVLNQTEDNPRGGIR
ncbi:MAG: ATP-dependent sacrificial sulfur transferase LarE [Candidatus Omnitrophica bacterium]|nr:ATP-dependent sacrificial sulfur transferase LarE [Candidatus Omnitrophota bacterium]